MKRFEDVLSPLSWLVLYLGFFPLFLAVFRPSLKEFLVFYAVDFVALAIMRALDRRLFLKLYPDAIPYYVPELAPLETLSIDEKVAVYQSMSRCPERRARYCVAVSFLKALPGAAVVVFYWQHTVGNFMQFLLIMGVSFFIYSYFYGAIYIETHTLVSRRLAEWHKRYDWSEVFRRVPIDSRSKNFEFQEGIALASIFILMILLQWLIIKGGHYGGSTSLALQLSIVGISGVLLTMRLWYLGRFHFVGGLQSLFRALEDFDPEKFHAAVPLHSSATLARFEKTFNSLMDRLRAYRQELWRWITFQAEESRFRALGEISALIVHDLSAPLHVIRFCTEELRNHPERFKDGRYIEQLSVNGKRSLELIDSLKGYLRNTGGSVGVELGDAYRDARRLLESQFFTEDFKKITFDTDAASLRLKLRIAKADLIHILVNLIGNSVQNLLAARISDARIRVFHEAKDPEEACATLLIRDNGTGMRSERFERLTGVGQLPPKEDPEAHGLGLRLVRRLAEKYEGELSVRDLPSGEAGTLVALTLPLL